MVNILLVCIATWFALGIAPASYAQPSTGLVLYGIVDTGMGFTNIKGQETLESEPLRGNRFGMSSGAQSGSRWGLHVTEHLNPDTRVIAILEQGLFSNTGQLAQGGLGFGRQSTLSVDSKTFGRLDFGRQINLASNYFLAIDPFVMGFGQANMGASFGSADTFRYANMLLYQTPAGHPWRFGVGYSSNLSASAIYLNSANPQQQPSSTYFANKDNLRGLTLGARYENDYVTVAASFDAAYAPDNIPAGSTPFPLTPNTDAPMLKEWILGASFKWHPKSAWRWSAAIGQTFNGSYSGQTPGNNFIGTGLPTNTFGADILFAKGYNVNSYMLGFTWQIDAVQKLFGSWQAMQPNMNITTVAPLAFAQTASLGYTYNFSAQTNLYVWTSYGKNFQLFAGNKVFEIGMGLRYLF
jgi:predicted porin